MLGLSDGHVRCNGSCSGNYLLLVTKYFVQGGSNMTGTDLGVNEPHYAAAVRP